MGVLGSDTLRLTVTNGGHCGLFGSMAPEENKCGSLENNTVTQGRCYQKRLRFFFSLRTASEMAKVKLEIHFPAVMEAKL